MMAELPAPVDLTNCDREPIHIPGSVQPHGVLLAVNSSNFEILQVAGETKRLLGPKPNDLIGRPVGDVVNLNADFLSLALTISQRQGPLYIGSFESRLGESRSLDLTAHERDGHLILELEPSAAPRETAAQILAKLRAIGTEFDTAPGVPQLCETATRAVRRLTGFDRVMIYRFLDDGAGCVIAEDKLPELPPFLNHHYPASDIPKQARALYVRNPIRVIPDVGYTPAPLTPAMAPPLDMTDCSLRSVSPIHIQYLKNMGVAASMSVSLVRDGTLWGLIACHHTTPKHVPYELREACKHVGQILSQQIRAREEAELHHHALKLGAAGHELVRNLSQGGDVEAPLMSHCADVCALIPADGAAILHGENIVCVEHTPTEAQIRQIAQWLISPEVPDPYATDCLSEGFNPASAYAARASGLLATIVSREDRLMLMWFRAEHIETINWAGNPHKPAEPGADAGALNPRKSFDLWKETVRNRSRSWLSVEVEAARRFREAVFELRQRQKLRDLNVQLRRTLADKEELLAQKDLLMREVNHRVQNSLQLVNSMLSLQARELTDPEIKAHFDEASRRIMAVSMVHQRLWRSDQIQNVDFGTYLGELREGLIRAWGSSWAPHLRIHSGSILLPTDQAIVLALVITELLTNVVKYAYKGAAGPIDITVKEQPRKAIRVTVADRGVGIGPEARSTGLGSRLTHALVAQLRGEIEVASNDPGTRVTLTVPIGAHAEIQQ